MAAAVLFLLVRALRRGRWRELVLALAAVALMAAAAEGTLRALRPYESLCRFRWLASARYHHVNPPSRRMFTGYVQGRPIVVETNGDGLRTAYSRSGFGRHAVRVALLGDSFVFGSGVDAREAVAARLELRLRQRPGAAAAAVLNAGVISYSPFLERRLFEDVIREYRPTHVLLMLDVTDIGDDAIYARKAGGENGSFPLEGDTSLSCPGALHGLVRPPLAWAAAQLAYPARRIGAGLGRRPAPAPSYYLDSIPFQGRPENRYFIYRHPLEQTAAFFEATLARVDRIAAAAARAGARFALVVVPRYHHWSSLECRDNWERGVYEDDEPFEYEYFRFFGQAASRVPYPVVDLLPAFRATAEFPLVFPNDPHWNARGHDFVARTIVTELAGRSLLP